MASIGLVGLGNAGRPMAERILAKGHSLTVFDIDAEALNRVVERGARQAHSAGAAVSDITITLLASSVEVRQAVFGANRVLNSLRPASTVIDLSGTDPDCARELEERLRETQATFIGGAIPASRPPAVVIAPGQVSGCLGR